MAVAAFALWFSGRIRAKERKLPPGSPTGANITRAMSTGQLPEGASAEEWVPELSKIIRQERHMGWIGPLMFGFFTAIGIFLIFDRPGHPWFGIFCSLYSTTPGGPIFLDRRVELRMKQNRFPSVLRRL